MQYCTVHTNQGFIASTLHQPAPKLDPAAPPPHTSTFINPPSFLPPLCALKSSHDSEGHNEILQEERQAEERQRGRPELDPGLRRREHQRQAFDRGLPRGVRSRRLPAP